MTQEKKQIQKLQERTVDLITDVEKLQQKAVLGEVFMYYICGGDHPEILSREDIDEAYACYIDQLRLIRDHG